MSQGSRYPRRASLSGWWKCAPLLALPFGIFFSEAWLQTTILRNHYKIHELTLEQRALETEIKALSDGRNRLSRIERIDAQATRLGLFKPLPGQMRIVRERATLGPASPALDEISVGAPAAEGPTRLAMSELSSHERRFPELEAFLPPMDGLPGTD